MLDNKINTMRRKRFANRCVFLALFIVAIAVVIFSSWMFQPRSAPFTGVKDRHIVLDISQIRSTMTYIYHNEGNYDNFNCDHEEMIALCQDIDKNYGLKDGVEPIITHDTPNNSQAACIYSPMNWKNNYWYCADSIGAVGYVKINPGGVGYCIEGESAVCPPLEGVLSKLPKQEIKPPEVKTSEEKITLEDETAGR